MYHKLWKISQVDELISKFERETDSSKRKNYLEIILPEIKTQIELLDSNYGADRDPDKDGGWMALFMEPITEENALYKELLGKYNILSSEYAEINEYIAEDTDIRYTMQLFVMTEFHLIIIYPSFKENKMTMIPKCFEIVPPRRYMTKGINENLPSELMMFLWNCIDQAGSTMSLDYLQIFKFRVKKDENGKLIQYIEHSQEVPPYSKEHMMEAIDEGINDDTIYVIDNIEYQTMMWSRDY